MDRIDLRRVNTLHGFDKNDYEQVSMKAGFREPFDYYGGTADMDCTIKGQMSNFKREAVSRFAPTVQAPMRPAGR